MPSLPFLGVGQRASGSNVCIGAVSVPRGCTTPRQSNVLPVTHTHAARDPSACRYEVALEGCLAGSDVSLCHSPNSGFDEPAAACGLCNGDAYDELRACSLCRLMSLCRCRLCHPIPCAEVRLVFVFFQWSLSLGFLTGVQVWTRIKAFVSELPATQQPNSRILVVVPTVATQSEYPTRSCHCGTVSDERRGVCCTSGEPCGHVGGERGPGELVPVLHTNMDHRLLVISLLT